MEKTKNSHALVTSKINSLHAIAKLLSEEKHVQTK